MNDVKKQKFIQQLVNLDEDHRSEIEELIYRLLSENNEE